MARWAQWLRSVWPGRGQAVAAAYVRTFAGDDGKRVLADLAVYCHAARSSFVAGDPQHTAFNEGARDAFNHIRAMAGLSWADIAGLIEEEHHVRHRSEPARTDRNTPGNGGAQPVDHPSGW